MEKRLVVFLSASVLIMLGYSYLRMQFAPPPKQAEQQIAENETDGANGEDGKQDPESTESGADGNEDPEASMQPNKDGDDAEKATDGDVEVTDDDGDKAIPAEINAPAIPEQRIALGSFAPGSPYRLLVVLNNRGATVERVDLVERRSNGKLRYRDLTHRYGYLGIGCEDTDDGCRVTVVGPGTPAAEAVSSDVAADSAKGLLAGDLIQTANGLEVLSRADLDYILEKTTPGEDIKLVISRPTENNKQTIEFTASLAYRPLELIRPETVPGEAPTLSYLVGLQSLGNSEARFDQDELRGFLSLRDTNWTVEQPAENEVVFRQNVKFTEGDATNELEFTKRFRLAQAATADHSDPSYHLELAIEVKNLGSQTQTLTFNMDGPNGLPTEGWWYSNKIHPKWGSAGARDVIWRVHEQRHSLRSAAEIYKQAQKTPDDIVRTILTDNPEPDQRTLDYLGVDTQYFSAVTMRGSVAKPDEMLCKQAYALPIGPMKELKGRKVRTLNSTYRYVSDPLKIEPDQTVSQNFHVFLGPKSAELLGQYGLTDIIEYGWFGWIAKPLGKLLHLFHFFLRNYGLAIILLTVLVRGLMFPIGRKAARNAQMMQELAPEIKKIKEKYKNDMEKQAQAQRELWKQHSFNPLGGCWLMFLQLPIFIGLYRCLSVDIELRQASLIPGIQWCSNLSGPDMFFYWKTESLGFLTSETGWLGPYLNILPIITIILFLLQQKLFTPPATDDQSRMQQKMMKYMMVFMGVLFFKVPSGLCIYFVASSLWGIAERKLLPKSNLKKTTDAEKPKKGAIQSLVDRLKDKAETDPAALAKARKKRRRK